MSDSCPVQGTGRRAIVTLPRLVGESDASQIREELHQRAAASSIQLRLAVTSEPVRRELIGKGLDRLIPIHSSLEAGVGR